jgi:hypothetical protein
MHKDTKNTKNTSPEDTNPITAETLAIEQMKLNNESIGITNAERRNNVLSNKIEQARRNVEVISKVVGSFQDDIAKNMNDVLIINLEVLKEITKL